MTFNQGCPSSNFSATSSGHSAPGLYAALGKVATKLADERAFAPDELGRLHGLCFVHLQGPEAKRMYLARLLHRWLQKFLSRSGDGM